jgi:hypothetical protein
MSTNPSTGFADQLVKDVAGDWVSSLIGNSVAKYTPLDVLRFEIGFGSVGVHAEAKVIENIKVLTDAEQTVRGQTLNVRGDVKTNIHFSRLLDDRLSLQGGYLSKTYYDPAEQDIPDWKG